jgi:thiol:disulfide interchange protein DsbD
MMKIKASILFLFLSVGLLNAQVYDPVDWEISVEEGDGNTADLVFKATIDEGWHVYATELPSEMGPIPTSVTLEEGDEFEALGKAKGGKYKTEYDPNFDMDLNYYDNSAVFKQRIKRIATSDFKVAGYLTFMVCNDEMCLPPEDIDFSLEVAGAEASAEKPKAGGLQPIKIQPIQEEEIFEPVTWYLSVAEEDETSALLVFEAEIEEEWHLYSTTIDIDDDGPLPTEIVFEEIKGYELDGVVGELEPTTEYDKVFEMDVEFFSKKARFTQRITKKAQQEIEVKGYVNYMVCDDERCIMDQEEFVFNLMKGVPEGDGNTDNASTVETADDDNEKQSYWKILVLAILGGFAALLTPCVFPMVPMTVSFFTKQSKSKSAGIKNALIYGFSIILVYLALSVPFHIFESISPDILNEVSTNAPLNIFFFIVFIVFAISFFGAFEITMPASWVNKADKASDIGGIVGIFFMAIVLVLVSFSCTGPLLGALLGSVLSTDGGAMALTVGMLGFGLGLALPFGLFAAFPSWLNTLPKSGGWLNTVKVFLGFLELALAFKFLSNADLVLQAHLLPREVFLAIWIAIFFAMTLYLFGFFRMPHDSKVENLGVGRMLLGVFSLFFTLYLLPGLWGAPLKMISGFPPPSFYSESPGLYASKAPVMVGESGEIPEGADPEHCPLGLNCFHDYEQGLAYAKKVNKPILLDFTGWACVNCRKMEEQVWSDPRILSILRNEVVLISLYVDERKKLPEEEQYVSETTGKKIRTVGNLWSDFQIKNFKNNSQPYYVMLGHGGLEPLHESAAYDPDIDLYEDWLQRGIAKFQGK